MGRSDAKIKEGAAPFLKQGEEVIAAFVARPRGWTQSSASPGGGAVAGMVGGAIGGKKQRESREGAQEAGFELASPMALGITPTRLVSLKVTAPVGLGIGMKVQELLSAVPLAEVDSIEVKRLAMGKTVTVTIRGASFVLEAGAGADAKGVAEALERTKAAVG